MSSSTRSSGTGSGAARGLFWVTDGDLRVSDAERADAADRLSRHYGDGRLDKAEFDQRLDRAMNATTRADLRGLFADLPEGGAAGPRGASQHAGQPATSEPAATAGPHRQHRALTLLAVLVVVVIAAHAATHLFLPWLPMVVLVLAVFLVWLIDRRHRRD